jgi:tetratricopeptide (TPR) repeat protein
VVPAFAARVGATLLCLALSSCASKLERGEALYRQGDVRAALAAWRAIEPGESGYSRARARLEIVEAEVERSLRRWEKQAAFFENQGRLAEAVLYYRLTLKVDPDRDGTLERVQRLVRELARRAGEQRSKLQAALDGGRLVDASRHASELSRLDPFDPAIQIDLRQVQAAVGSEVMRNIEDGRRAYASGERERALASFRRVLDLDEANETAQGYLSYLQRLSELEQERVSAPGLKPAAPTDESFPPPPRTVSQEEIRAEGHYRSATRAEERGDPFRALAEYESALRLDPKHRAARRRLQALRTELVPRIEELYETGKRYFQEDDLRNALRVWRQVLLIDPRHERTRENVDRAERILSRIEELQTSGG